MAFNFSDYQSNWNEKEAFDALLLESNNPGDPIYQDAYNLPTLMWEGGKIIRTYKLQNLGVTWSDGRDDDVNICWWLCLHKRLTSMHLFPEIKNPVQLKQKICADFTNHFGYVHPCTQKGAYVDEEMIQFISERYGFKILVLYANDLGTGGRYMTGGHIKYENHLIFNSNLKACIIYGPNSQHNLGVFLLAGHHWVLAQN